MFTRDGKLQVFESFSVDRGLPKFQQSKTQIRQSHPKNQKSQYGTGGEEDEEMESATFGSRSVFMSSNEFIVTEGNITLAQGTPIQKTLWYQKFLNLFKPKSVPPKPPVATMAIPDFFKSVQNSAEEIQIVEARLTGYLKALRDAEHNRQTALHEKISQDILAVRAETQLHAIGLSRYISEETLVDFVKKCPKGLRLDYIRNFMRVIPEDVATKKTQCDAVGAFDNYAILHYDPEAKSWAQTEQEKKEEEARKRDPILFGLIAGRRRLYFVGDWVDDQCNLTLEQIAELLGAKAISQVAHTYTP